MSLGDICKLIFVEDTYSKTCNLSKSKTENLIFFTSNYLLILVFKLNGFFNLLSFPFDISEQNS